MQHNINSARNRRVFILGKGLTDEFSITSER
jgi:hypothetical protein